MTAPNDLVLTRLIAVPRTKIWRCWTEPELLKQWFCPKPWTVSHAELDVRTGGVNRFVMRSPEGEEHPNDGVYLEVIPERRLVATDAYTVGWVPSAKPFMTLVLDLSDEAGGTRYVAAARHWTAADRDSHEAMGFHAGWNAATDQLEELVRRL